MAGQNEATETVTDRESARTRQRSTIGFPYMDLNSAIELARAIHSQVGHGECDDDQLANWSDQSPKSSTFRVQVYAARTFGVLQGEADRHALSPIGQAIVDPQRERRARVDAFLHVPLFKALYDKYKGTVLPPTAALERDIAMLGVADKQKSRARQVFERSAEQAGFFEHGKNRLVMPGVSPGAAPPRGKSEAGGGHAGGGEGKGGSGNGDDGGPTDPLIDALIRKLPGSGKDFSADARMAWLRMMAGAFDMVYGPDLNITVDIKPDEKD